MSVGQHFPDKFNFIYQQNMHKAEYDEHMKKAKISTTATEDSEEERKSIENSLLRG